MVNAGNYLNKIVTKIKIRHCWCPATQQNFQKKSLPYRSKNRF